MAYFIMHEEKLGMKFKVNGSETPLTQSEGAPEIYQMTNMDIIREALEYFYPVPRISSSSWVLRC